MSLVAVLKAEMHLWKSAWQQIETFLDRIDSAREQDDDHAKKARAMLQIAAVIEEERKLRGGTGLDVPLEMALARGGASSLKDTDLGPVLTALFAPGSVSPPKPSPRLPGAYDVEIAVAPLRGLVDQNLELKQAYIRYAELIANDPPLFDRHDDQAGSWVPVVAPAYDFGTWTAWDSMRLIDIDGHDVNGGILPRQTRINLTTKGPDPSDPDTSLRSWTTLRNERRGALDQKTKDLGLLALLHQLLWQPPSPQGSTLSQDINNTAKQASKACSDGAKAVDALLGGALEDAVFPELDPGYDFGKDLGQVSSALRNRVQIYDRIRDAASKLPTNTPFADGTLPQAALLTAYYELQKLSDAGVTGLYAAEGAAYVASGVLIADTRGAAGKLLDEAIEARVEYPDGTLRILRMLEWTFRRVWDARVVWFDARRKRYLAPLLFNLFLGTFLQSLATMFASLPNLRTGTQFRARLATPLVTGATSIKLSKESPYNLDLLKPGSVVVVEGDTGERRALAVVLGLDTPAGGLERLRISPLRISMSGKLPPPAVAGMITRGKLDDGPATLADTPLTLADAGLRAGIAAGAPGDDGVAEELLALWSRLCLVLGNGVVGKALKAVRPGSSGELPTFLTTSMKLPVRGPIAPHAQKLVLDVSAIATAGLDLDGAAQPVIARPGELLLISGSDDQGHAWQGVVEVLSIVRTTPDKIDDDPVLPPAGTQICCQGPGSVIVIQVKDTTFPVSLASNITLHRDFKGFGAPSLAAGVLLPGKIDDANKDESGPYRGPEFKAACDVLSGWMWQPP